MCDREDIETIIDEILVTEGWPAFTVRPHDRGGPTKGGITFETFAAWRARQDLPAPTVAELEALDEPTARLIYRDVYVLGPRFHSIEDPILRLNVVDAGVLHGPGWSARRLQEVAEVTVDGDIGPETLGAVNDGPDGPLALNLRFTRRRIDKCIRIAVHDPSQLRWLKGWVNRAGTFLELEAELAGGP